MEGEVRELPDKINVLGVIMSNPGVIIFSNAAQVDIMLKRKYLPADIRNNEQRITH